MISLRKLLYDIENSEQEKNAVIQPDITLDDLYNTSKSLEKLSSSDREIDVMAKFAVLMDFGLSKEASGVARKIGDTARKALWEAEDLLRAAKTTEKAKKLTKETKRIQEGRTLGDYKTPIITGAAAIGAYYLGTKQTEGSKKDELRNVARKYFSLGRQSSGGA